jgi:hypothetical protein
MAKYLREIAEKGSIKTSYTSTGGDNKSTSGELNIDNLNDAKGNRDFAAKHKTQKWEDRNGNGDEVFKGKTKEAKYQKQSASVYEAKGMKCESCGSMYEGESCGCGKSVPEAKPGKKGMLVDKNVKEEVEQINELSKNTMKSYVKKALDTSSEKSVSNLASRGGYEMGKAPDDDIDAGQKHDRKAVVRSRGIQRAVNKLTNEETKTNTLRSVLEGAKVDRMVKHIKASEKAAGKSDEKAENIAWATVNKRGMLNNKNKKVEEQAPADTPMKITYPSDEVGQVGRV